MNLFRTFFTAGAVLALTQGQLAHAATNADGCLSEAELGGLVGYALPSVINGTMKACMPHLSPSGFFATRGTAFAGQYVALKDSNWPVAKNAFLKLGGTKDASLNSTLKALPDSALQPFVEAMVSEMVGGEIKPGQCTAIERGVRILAPLPAENTAELITFIVMIADKPKAGKPSSLPICKAAS